MPQRSVGLNALATVTALLASFVVAPIANAEILNGGFETGDLSGWIHSGSRVRMMYR